MEMLWWIPFLGCLASLACAVENDSGVTRMPSAAQDTDANQRPIDKGLQPLYIMTATFLDLVQPEWRTDVFDDPRFQTVFQQSDLQSSLVAIGRSFSDWQFWLRSYIGYTVCVAVGVAFIILIPLVGLCFCACRCAGRCGARHSGKGARRGDTCRRTGCGLLLLLINTLITAGIVCAFLTNELIRQQTSTTSGGRDSSSAIGSRGSDVINTDVISSVVSSLKTLQAYQNTTVRELNTGVLAAIQQEIDDINADLDGFSNKSIERLAEVTNIYSLMDAATSLSNSLSLIGRELTDVQRCSLSLQADQKALNASLIHSKRVLLEAIPSDSRCGGCVALRQRIEGLSLVADFTQLQNVTSELKRLEGFINGEVRSKLDSGRSELNNFTSRIQDQVGSQIQQVNQKADQILSTGRNLVGQVSNAIESVDVGEASQFMSETVAPRVKTYGDYRYYVGIALSSLLALMVCLALLGLCFGACGEAAGEDAGACNRGVGASFLMADVGVTFLFTWLLMVAVVVLFVTGGVGYTEVCRPLAAQADTGLVKVADRVIAAQLNKTKVRLNLIGVMTSCANDSGLYSALNLDSVYNLTGVFDSAKTQIKNAIDDLVSSIQPDLQNFVLIDPSVFDQLASAKVFARSFNFTTFSAALNQPIVTTNISSLANELKWNASQIPNLNDTMRQTIFNESDTLSAQAEFTVTSMLVTSKNLSRIISSLQNSVGSNGSQLLSNQIQNLTDSLNHTQQMIQNNSSAIIVQFVEEFALDLYSNIVQFADDLLARLRYKIGRCRTVYDAIGSATHSVCQSFLNPYNGFWFSVGWCLFFCVPSIIVCVKLVGLYRRTDDYYTDASKSFDDACYDAYAGPRYLDNYRMDDLRSQPANHSSASEYGHSNLVYEPDDIVQSASTQSDAARLHGYPGARVSAEGLGSDPGFIRPSYSVNRPSLETPGAADMNRPLSHFFYPNHDV